jgi:hypothetical protein
MKIILKFLIAAVLVAGCGGNPVAPEVPDAPLYSGTIPVTEGNTWVYQHDYLYHQESPYQPTRRMNGLLTISITTVSTSAQGDSTFFSATMVDSGDSVYDSQETIPVLDSNGNFVPTVFYYHDTNAFIHYANKYYVVTNNVLSAMDSDTNSTADLPFFSYTLLPDSTKTAPPSMHMFDFSRHSFCTTVTFNSSDTLALWTTETCSFLRIHTDESRDSCATHWLENIGCINYSLKKSESSSYGAATAESYSLLSFNGSPVTVSR